MVSSVTVPNAWPETNCLRLSLVFCRSQQFTARLSNNFLPSEVCSVFSWGAFMVTRLQCKHSIPVTIVGIADFSQGHWRTAPSTLVDSCPVSFNKATPLAMFSPPVPTWESGELWRPGRPSSGSQLVSPSVLGVFESYSLNHNNSSMRRKKEDRAMVLVLSGQRPGRC